MTAPRAPITIGKTSLSCSTVSSIPEQGRGIYPSFHFLSILFCGQPEQQSPQSCMLFLICWLIQGHGRLAEIRWSVCMSKSQRSLCMSYFRTDVGLCSYHLFVWSDFNFLHNSQWIPLLTQSCLFLYSSQANLLKSLIIWPIVYFLSVIIIIIIIIIIH